jgi:hypothetical protein
MNAFGPKTIICAFDSDANHWVAHFGCAPQIKFNGTVPMRAIQRLLEGAVVAAGRYPLDCDAARDVPAPSYRVVRWNPPKISLEVGAKEPPDWRTPDIPVFGVKPADPNPDATPESK